MDGLLVHRGRRYECLSCYSVQTRATPIPLKILYPQLLICATASAKAGGFLQRDRRRRRPDFEAERCIHPGGESIGGHRGKGPDGQYQLWEKQKSAVFLQAIRGIRMAGKSDSRKLTNYGDRTGGDWAIQNMPKDFEIQEFLIGHRAEVKDLCITEYNEAEAMQMIREEGDLKRAGKTAANMLKDGDSIDKAARVLELSPDTIRAWMEKS